MNKFLLYQKKEKVFPSSIQIQHKFFDIDPDFRNILRILAFLNDINVSDLKKIDKFIQWFFINPEDLFDFKFDIIMQIFADFINPAEHDKPDNYDYNGDYNNSEKQFDYDFDSEEIYAGFIAEYNIDLIEIDFLHWYKFKILLNNLSPDSAFKKKLQLRHLDLSDYQSNDAHSQKYFLEIAKAKSAVQLPYDYDGVYQELQEFQDLWGNL